MKELNLGVTRGTLSYMTINYENAENLPIVTAQIKLSTEAGLAVGAYTISSKSWDKNTQFELSANLAWDIKSIAEHMETILADHCMATQKLLETTLEG